MIRMVRMGVEMKNPVLFWGCFTKSCDLISSSCCFPSQIAKVVHFCKIWRKGWRSQSCSRNLFGKEETSQNGQKGCAQYVSKYFSWICNWNIVLNRFKYSGSGWQGWNWVWLAGWAERRIWIWERWTFCHSNCHYPCRQVDMSVHLMLFKLRLNICKTTKFQRIVSSEIGN